MRRMLRPFIKVAKAAKGSEQLIFQLATDQSFVNVKIKLKMSDPGMVDISIISQYLGDRGKRIKTGTRPVLAA